LASDGGETHYNIGNEFDSRIRLLALIAQPEISSMLFSKSMAAKQERARLMMEAYERGWAQEKIARAFGTTQQNVSQIIYRMRSEQ